MIAKILVNQSEYRLEASRGEELREQFERERIVRLPGFFTPEGFDVLRREVERLLARVIRRNLEVQGSEGTPRRMSTLGGDVVSEYSSLIPALYTDPGLLAFLSGVAGDEVLPVPDPVENHVLNVLHEMGDIHGGHVDTYAFAFNLCIEAPGPGGGGELEMVPGSTVLAELDGDAVRRVAVEPGEAYLLRTDDTAHRVAPLTRPGRRTIINLAYADPATVELQSYSSSVLYGSGQEELVPAGRSSE